MLNQWTSSLCTKCTSYLGSIRTRPDLERLACAVILPSHSYHNTPRVSSSKTTSNSSSLMPSSTTEANSGIQTQQGQSIPHFSGFDIRELDANTRIKLQSVSSEIATAQASFLMNRRKGSRRRKEILRMDESEYAGTAILQKRAPLLDRRGEAQSHFLRSLEPDKRNNIDRMSLFQADIDIRPEAVKRWWATLSTEQEIKEQEYNPKRNRILGNELAAAHFIVARGGKVKFLGQNNWITTYRKDAKPDVPEEDLPVMSFELCTLPVNYDPRYRVEAIDATGVQLYYEGLANFENLHYLKWLGLRDSPFMDDWCLDRIARMFGEKLEYIDLSGCKNITDRGIGTLHRCKKLKVLLVENMSHLENLEIVCAMLEDHIPELQVIGIDYIEKTEKLKLEGDELERKAKDEEAKLEANTITIEAIESGTGTNAGNTTGPDETNKESILKIQSRPKTAFK